MDLLSLQIGLIGGNPVPHSTGGHVVDYDYGRIEREKRKKREADEAERKRIEREQREAEAAQLAQIEREKAEARDRKNRLAVRRANLILAREESERAAIQEEIELLQMALSAYYQRQKQREETERKKEQDRLAVAQANAHLAELEAKRQEEELINMMMLFMMEM